MGTVKCFEEFKIWQDARELVKQVYLYTGNVKDYGFNDQIRRAAVSVMNNIAEGYEAGSNVMFKKFLQIAKGSCGEVRSMLYLTKDLGYINEIQVNKLLSDCFLLSKGINKLIIYLENHDR
jgi:S23 ribosomal protein